jgi:formylmethanofuran dehydrogenase subunit D
MEKFFTLITGRTKKQAHGLHKGIGSPDHIAATSYVEICSDDMASLGIVEGQKVKLLSDAGTVELTVHATDIPVGLLFVPMGPAANQLVGAETFGTGMPSFKGMQIKVNPL